MPLNKFGEYLYYKKHDHRLSAPVPTEDFSSFKTMCILSLRGRLQENSLFYLLENNTNSYEFQITGLIEHVEVSTNSLEISINSDHPIPYKNLIDRHINKGDVISIVRQANQPPIENVFIEFLLICPLIKK